MTLHGKAVRTPWCVLGLIMAFAALPALADGGKVVAVVGTGAIQRGDVVTPAERGAALKAGDTLETPLDSKLQWWMQDDSVLTMASNSRVRIDHFQPRSGEARYRLERGGMRVVSGTVKPTVSTAHADVTAVGTDFSAFICKPGCGAEAGLYVRVDEGSVRVHNSAGSVTAGKGQFVFAASARVAPTVVSQAPTVFLEVLLELEFEFGLPDVRPPPELPIQPIPPVDPPGGPTPSPTPSPGPTPAPTEPPGSPS